MDFAIGAGRVLITKDDDFAFRQGREGLAVAWLRIGNASNRVLALWLEERWDEVEAAPADGEMLVEVR